jgi:uncharacterized delta-60 repeat protein
MGLSSAIPPAIPATASVSGYLDPTFGAGGKTTASFGESTSFESFDNVEALILQPDGKVVAAGSTWAVPEPREGEELALLLRARVDFALARFLPDGGLDATFGHGGMVTTDLGGSDLVFALALQPDGKLLAAGTTQPWLTPSDEWAGDFGWALARYNADGSLDTAFGDGGRLIITRSSPGSLSGLVLQPDGRLVVAGFASDPMSDGPATARSAFFRFNPDGTPDPSFGVDGRVVLDSWLVLSLTRQRDGRLVAAGGPQGLPPRDSPLHFAMTRLDLDGSLDRSFGLEGRAGQDLVGIGGSVIENSVRAVALPDGRLLAVGRAGRPPEPERARRSRTDLDLVLARYNPDGTPDESFGVTGQVRSDFGVLDKADAIAVQTDGRLVAIVTSPDLPNPLVVRYDADGTLDPGFGDGGRIVTDVGRGTPSAIVIQADMKPVIAVKGQRAFLVARYQG